MEQAFRNQYGEKVCMRLLSTTEMNKYCNQEFKLMSVLRGDDVNGGISGISDSDDLTCLFENIAAFVDQKLEVQFELSKNAGNMTFEELERIIITDRKTSVRLQAPCLRHAKKRGCCVIKPASVHVAGTPCPVFSSMPGHRCSKRRKGDHNALFYLLWVAQRLLLGDRQSYIA